MSLTSFWFLVFFAILLFVLSLLQQLRKKHSKAVLLQKLCLLISSYLFIALNDWRFSLCIAAISGFTYYFGILIENKKSKSILVFGIVFLSAFLAVFKYTNFFVNSFRFAFGNDTVTLKIILPIGISFYIFSCIAYLVDVFKGKYCAEKSFLNLALFISFFPKLTAGPIVRANEFLEQTKEYHGIELKNIGDGLQIFVFGLFKKIVLADHLNVFVNDVFHAPSAYGTFTVMLAVLSYSLQIYLDFSGYSDMAIGTSKMLGYEFKPNFNLPYIAKDISEFWKRWHISLSSWLKDYIYFPLGGSRRGTARTYFNLMIVMIVSGIWHGAGWTFVLWGGLHGVISCLNKLVGKYLKKAGSILNSILTFVLVSLLWIIFRAESLQNAFDVFKSLFSFHDGISQIYIWSFVALTFVIVSTIVAIIHSSGKGSFKTRQNDVNGFYPILNLNSIFGASVFLTVCGLTLLLGYFGNTAFIYGAF